MTREEYQKEIAYCYILNDRIRHRYQNNLGGFIWASILCTLFIPLSVLLGFKIAAVSQPLALGCAIGFGIAASILLGISIFFIVDCKKELKKCDEMDLTLAAEEEKLELMSEDSMINIEA